MKTHTPGPWTADWGVRGDDGTEEQWNVLTDDELICDLTLCDRDMPHATVAANARLIAAAPDLLAACILALSHIGNNSTFATVRAAIAKATGEAVQP